MSYILALYANLSDYQFLNYFLGASEDEYQKILIGKLEKIHWTVLEAAASNSHNLE